LGAVLIAPLFYTRTIDLQQLQLTYLSDPPMRSAPASPRRPVAVTPRQVSRNQIFNAAGLTMSIALPKTVQTARADTEPVPEAAGVAGDVVGGVPGGQAVGVLGGGLGGTLSEGLGAPPPLPTASAPSGPLHVGGEVKPSQLLSDPAPDYPRLALVSRIQGDVESMR
jgi:hypothetical protein